MAEQGEPKVRTRATEFEKQAERERGTSGAPVSEFLYFLGRTRNWWLLPIILALLTVGALLVLSGTAVAPLIYTLF